MHYIKIKKYKDQACKRPAVKPVDHEQAKQPTLAHVVKHLATPGPSSLIATPGPSSLIATPGPSSLIEDKEEEEETGFQFQPS